MRPMFVLLHSSALGLRSWQEVAAALAARDYPVTVPSLLDVVRAALPYWPGVLETVAEQLRQNPARPVVLVPHSNAGCFVPLLATGIEPEVRGCIFVDAALPGRSGETPVAPEAALPFLRQAATDGLPLWTQWWDDQDVRALFPDEATRDEVAAEQPRLPVAYFEQSVPVPAQWDGGPCAYVQFSTPYDEHAARARERGWRVHQLPGGHLHMLTDPAGLAETLATLAQWTGMTCV